MNKAIVDLGIKHNLLLASLFERLTMQRKRYIGVDLHTDNFVACFLLKGSVIHTEKFDVSECGFNKFKGLLNKRDEIAVEATSNSSYFINQVSCNVENVTLVAPGEFRVIGYSTKKTDLKDANQLALFLSKGMLPEARQKDFFHHQLLSLIDTRSLLVRSRLSLNLKTCNILVRHGIKISTSRLIYNNGFKKYVFCYEWEELTFCELAALEEQVTNLNKQILELEKTIVEYAKDLKGYENLTSINGIGSITGAIILCTIGNIDDFTNASKLTSYFGLAPKIRHSNHNKKQGRITKRGSKAARTAIITSTWQVIRYNQYLNNYYSRMKEAKGGKKAVVATSNKLIKIIYNALKNDWVFDDFPSYKYHVRTEKEL